MTEFQREERYFVIKISKMHPHPTFRAKHISALKREYGVALVDCVVVERDWPEYEHVWSLIESRITGAPTLNHVSCHSTIRKQSEQIDTLRAQLAERDALLRDINKRHSSGVDFDLPADLAARVKALSASAEQSAPVEIDELTDDQIIEAMREDLYDADGGYTIDACPEFIVKAGRALLARAALERKP